MYSEVFMGLTFLTVVLQNYRLSIEVTGVPLSHSQFLRHFPVPFVPFLFLYLDENRAEMYFPTIVNCTCTHPPFLSFSLTHILEGDTVSFLFK